MSSPDSAPDLNSPSKPVLEKWHSFSIDTLAWSPAGSRIAVGGARNRAQVWDAATGARVLTYHEHEWRSRVTAVTWSPDGQLIASGSSDATIRIWDAATGATHLAFRADAIRVNEVRWSPDGRFLASTAFSTERQRHVSVWDAQNGELLSDIEQTAKVWQVAWSPTGPMLASASADGTVSIWEVPSGRTVATLGTQGEPSVLSVAWSPDGRSLAAARRDSALRIWDSASWRTLSFHADLPESPTMLSWSGDGRYLAGRLAGTWCAWIWDARIGGVAARFGNELWPVSDMAWSPQDHQIATWGLSRQVLIWELGVLPADMIARRHMVR